MLTYFPSLLTFSFFAPTLLRVTAAAIFFYLTYNHYKHRSRIGQEHFPVIGRGEWVAWVAILAEVAVGLGLLLGYSTQIASLVGMLLAFKYGFWSGRYPSFFILTRMSAFLLFMLLLSLVFTGAGALAFDLPL